MKLDLGHYYFDDEEKPTEAMARERQRLREAFEYMRNSLLN